MKNQRKYLSYKEAWERINSAIEKGFYFEAVTLCESIISDRLLSYVKGENPKSTVDTRTHFITLIREWRRHVGGSLRINDANLIEEVDDWREQRNDIVHRLVKSEPGTPTDDVDSFLSGAKATAIEGKRLARQVSDWHKKQLRAATRSK